MENSIGMLILAIATLALGGLLISHLIFVGNLQSAYSIDKSSVVQVKDAVINLFYQPNSAINVVNIPHGVYMRIYCNNNTLYIQTKMYDDIVPHVNMTGEVLVNGGGTLLIRRLYFDNTTQTLHIQITKS